MDELEQHESDFAKLLSRVPFDDQARAEHRDALRLRVLAALDAADLPAPAPAAWKRILNQGRELMRRPVPRFIAAAATCLAAVAVWSLFPDRQPTAHAFNMFAEAIVEARTATFETNMKIEGMPRQKFQCYYLAPGKMRFESKSPVPDEMQAVVKMKEIEIVIIQDQKTGQSITLMPARKTATINNMKNRPEGQQADGMRIFEQMRDLLSKSKNATEKEFQPLGEKEIDGRRALGFRHTFPMGSMTLWGDPESGLPVLAEMKQTGKVSMEDTMSHFKLNEDLKPELFDMTPPEGYTVQTVEVDASTPTEASLMLALRRSANLNDGQFFDNLDPESLRALAMKKFVPQPGGGPPKLPEWFGVIMHGIQFVWLLPESADARYAGKGAKLDEPDRPIFWYKPAGGEKYRVIYANLKIRNASTPPNVAGAVRVEMPSPKETLAKAMAEINKPVDLSATIPMGTGFDRLALNNLKAIAAAMLAENDDKNRFPANIRDRTDKDGKPLLSWRVELLPYLKLEKLYNQFRLDEPWDSKHNKRLLMKMPTCYMIHRKREKPLPLGQTVIVRPTGNGTVFDGKFQLASPKLITDKPDETILLVEADDEHAVPWTKPEDLEIDPVNPAAGLLRSEPAELRSDPQDPRAGMPLDKNRYFAVARADGSAELLLADVDAATLWSFFTRAGGEKTEWPKRPKIEWTPPGPGLLKPPGTK